MLSKEKVKEKIDKINEIKERMIIKILIENPDYVLWQEEHLKELFEINNEEIKIRKCIQIARERTGTNKEIINKILEENIKKYKNDYMELFREITKEMTLEEILKLTMECQKKD